MRFAGAVRLLDNGTRIAGNALLGGLLHVRRGVQPPLRLDVYPLADRGSPKPHDEGEMRVLGEEPVQGGVRRAPLRLRVEAVEPAPPLPGTSVR